MSLGFAFLFYLKLHGMHLNSFPIIWFHLILLGKWNNTRTTVQLGIDKESLKNISKINSMKIIRNFKHLNVNLTLLLRPSLSVMISIWILRHKPIKNKKQHV